MMSATIQSQVFVFLGGSVESSVEVAQTVAREVKIPSNETHELLRHRNVGVCRIKEYHLVQAILLGMAFTKILCSLSRIQLHTLRLSRTIDSGPAI